MSVKSRTRCEPVHVVTPMLKKINWKRLTAGSTFVTKQNFCLRIYEHVLFFIKSAIIRFICLMRVQIIYLDR